ncbi:hypothetical protein PIB30_023594 [Stylosanthes scabra]|uniref:CG-1 domain-containing protein n=1 Tax=Stylosanthes scabra TaxID=79078 RepID=A0ABU6Y9X5_9FABA|nr:hypothetical protein [Stylosanthes scabra]
MAQQPSSTGQLMGSEIHGFHTLQGGSIILFDRKVLRNFRKDGYNWKKKNDGKTVKEAHEHLKVGNEERIHVYYAHGQDNPGLVRRCYWLLDKKLEHIVLVHYRETQESPATSVTPVNSHSSSASDQPTPWILSEELDSGTNAAYASGLNDNLTVESHEMKLHELNTLEWDDLVVSNNNTSTITTSGNVQSLNQQNQSFLKGSSGNVATNLVPETPPFSKLAQPIAGSNSVPYNIPENPSLQSQDSFGTWINNMISDPPPCSVDESAALESSISPLVQGQYSSVVACNQLSSLPEQVFTITDVSPMWASSTEKTKILVTGLFRNDYQHLAKSNLYCVCSDASIPVETVQPGVYRCWVSPHSPGFVNLYLSFDGYKPISQVVNFEYRTPLLHDPTAFMEQKYDWEEFRHQIRLTNLLFDTKKSLDIFSSKVSPKALKEAKKFAFNTSFISKSWQYLMKSTEENTIPFPQAKDDLFQIALKNRLKEWLLERISLGIKTTELDKQGQGVIHLCAILGYTWAVSLFSWSGLSLDFRDKFGWTALHWAAYYGREKMVGTLLSFGAKPNLVTDPTPQNPGGCTAADLACIKGYDGLAAYLSEKSLVEQVNDMTLAGNISGPLETTTVDIGNTENLTEDQLYLKETLASYRTAAEAAAAFRGFQMRKQYRKIIWSVGVLEKVILRWRLKRKGFRGLQVNPDEEMKDEKQESDIEEDFFRTSRRQAEERVERSVVRVQAMFRSKKAQEEYRRMKLAHNQAQLELEFEELLICGDDMITEM